MCTSDIPALRFFLFSLSCWMKGSRHIPFPSSGLGKWSGSLLYVGSERAGQTHNTSLWCCWYAGKHSAGMDGRTTQVLCSRPCPQPLDTRSKGLWLCVCVITQHSDVLNSRQVKLEQESWTTFPRLYSQRIFVYIYTYALWDVCVSFTVRGNVPHLHLTVHLCLQMKTTIYAANDLAPTVWWKKIENRSKKIEIQGLQYHLLISAVKPNRIKAENSAAACSAPLMHLCRGMVKAQMAHCGEQ